MNSYEPPIFVVGLPRTGSTLLENILGKSPGVLELAEVLYLSPWRRDFRYFMRKRVGNISRDENLRKLVDIIFTRHQPIAGITGSFWRLGGVKAMGEPELKERVFRSLQQSDRSLQSILAILLQEITQFNECRRCSVAFPVYINYLDTLFRWFPQAKVIHMTRDPRAVAISKTNDPGGTAIYNQKFPYLRYPIRKAMIAFVVVQYIWASRVHARFKTRSNYLLVRYEDLVLDPSRVVRDVCAFTGIEFTPEMLQQPERRGSRSSITGDARTTADATAASKWQHVITPLENFFVTSMTRPSMARFGFDPDAHDVYARTEWRQQFS